MSAVSERKPARVNRWGSTNKYKYERNWKFYTSSCGRLAYNKQCVQVFTRCCELCAGKGSQHAHKCKYRQKNARYWRPPGNNAAQPSKPSGQAWTPTLNNAPPCRDACPGARP